jgi:uncharacterized protein YbjT (DUF2867 family)
LQWVASGYALTFAGFLLLGGRVADLLGRRRIFMAGIMLFITASLAVTGGEYTAPGVFAAAVRRPARYSSTSGRSAGLGELLAAARGEGVSKIVLLSSATIRDHGEQDSALGAQHKMAEDAIKAADVDWTVLRCGGFATNTLAWAATVRADQVVRAPYGQAAMALIAE